MICSDSSCTKDAAVVVHWPSSGGPLPKCAQCAAWAVKVATAMGFDLPISSLEPLLATQVELALGERDDDAQ